MDQQQLIDRLEERVVGIPVGVAPVDAMRAAVRRRRRGRATVLAAVVACVALATGLAAWQLAGGGPQTPVPSAPLGKDLPPAGYRYVGLGNAVIAVPEDWGHREIKCATVDGDLISMMGGTTCLAAASRRSEVESIQVRQLVPAVDDIEGWVEGEVDGEQAYRSPLESHNDVITGAVYVPAYDAVFVARSTSAAAASVVEERLGGIAMLRAHTVLPQFEDLALDEGTEPMMDAYAARLRDLGLSVEVAYQPALGELGTVLAVDPPVGTIVAPGDTITVTASR
jgi:hypothetical protein